MVVGDLERGEEGRYVGCLHGWWLVAAGRSWLLTADGGRDEAFILGNDFVDSYVTYLQMAPYLLISAEGSPPRPPSSNTPRWSLAIVWLSQSLLRFITLQSQPFQFRLWRQHSVSILTISDAFIRLVVTCTLSHLIDKWWYLISYAQNLHHRQ